MSGRRQKNRPEQEVLAFPAESRSDAPKAVAKGTETLTAKHRTESLAGTERLMEEVCELENGKQALQRVKANKGSPGVDGMTVDELPEYLQEHGLEIGEQLRNGTYQPQPVRRVEIPKPDGAGVRKLGIPCVLDRFVQQAVLQVLQKRSPLLSNLVLDELDRELERRGHRFVRYADDCNLYVGSERARQRVMESVTHFITHRLKLKVNQAKSAVAQPR